MTSRPISLVINYDLPAKFEDYYSRRIGRVMLLKEGVCCLEFGRILQGTVINIVSRADRQLLKRIESFFDTNIEKLPANFADLI